jgi:eukaryotic-like serine/threonine-protein kinase
MTSAGASPRDLWQRVKTIAADAWAQPADQQAPYVHAAAGGDETVETEALSLLQAMGAVGQRFDVPALAARDVCQAAAEVIAAGRPVVVGESIGPWRLIRELGRGGMAVVYLAERNDSDFVQRAAIKLVRAAVDDEVLLGRFREERRILAALDHPLIARFIDGGTTAMGLPYVVMEYVEGIRIDAFCERRALAIRERVELFRKVCSAVHYAHQRLVVHRDLKASNILVDGDGRPKLLDFGIAKILDPAISVDLTRTLARMVTPESASPEQIRGDVITTASDVYGLGVMLYRLLTGRSPYRTPIKSDAEMMRAICDDPPVPPNTGVRDLDLIVLKALRKESERRYTTADQFAEDLERFLTLRPVLAADDNFTYRARKFIGRHRVSVASAVAVVVAISIGTATAAWQARVAERERNRAQRQFNAVRTLAASLLGELHDAVAQLPNSLPARELLMRRATDYLDSLATEAGGDPALRRELAFGYRRLGEIQGLSGMPNLGEHAASKGSYEKAAALFESLGDRSLDVDSRLVFAQTYLGLANTVYQTNEPQREDYRRRAQVVIDPLLLAMPSDPKVLATAGQLWWTLGVAREGAKDYAGAEALFLKAVRAGEARLQASPQDAAASRNLSIMYRKVGTEEELQDRRDEAIEWYRKALALDLSRLQQSPALAVTMLDVSFSRGAIGSALFAKGETVAALDEYRQAVELRRQAVAREPNDEFAIGSLLRGHDRLASMLQRAGDGAGMFDAHRRRLALSRQRLSTHPGREEVWRDHGNGLADAVAVTVALLDAGKHPGPLDKEAARHIEGLFRELLDLRSRAARRLPPLSLMADGDVQQLAERSRRALDRLGWDSDLLDQRREP